MRLDLVAPPRPALAGADRAWAALLVGAAAILLVLPAVVRLAGYATTSFDLGIYAHAFWHAAQGNGLENAIEGGDHLKSHASPLLYALVPLYRLAPRVETLVGLHGVVLALCAWPAFALARRHLARGVSLALVLVLFMHPAWPTMARDVHAVCLALPLLFGALWALDAGRSRAFLACAGLALLAKENVSLVVAALALVGLASGRLPRAVCLLALGGALAWLATALHVIIPAFGGDHHAATMSRFAHLGDSWGALLLAPIRAPGAFWGGLFSGESAAYLWRLLAPAGGLPLLSPAAWALALPDLAQNLLSSHVFMRSHAFHYEALLLPALWGGSVWGLARLHGVLQRPGLPARVRAGARYVVLGLALLGVARALDPATGFHVQPLDPTLVAEVDALVAAVPPDASVASPQALMPHLAQRPVSAHLGSTNVVLRAGLRPYQLLVVPVADSPVGRVEAGYGEPDFPGYVPVHRGPHLVLLRRTPAP